MTSLYAKAIEQIPQVVAEIANYNGVHEKPLEYSLVVKEYSNNDLVSIRPFAINEYQMLDHIDQAKSQRECTIEITDTVITITRGREGSPKRFVAEYTPIYEEER